MGKRIIDKVRARKEVVLADKKAAEENRAKSVEAVLGGIDSPAWETYMQQFAETPEQLKRLIGTDGTRNDFTLNVKRAYLAASAVCGPPTTTEFDREVETIDDPPAKHKRA
ncbi:MAG: hypothetical protein HYR56_10930 [Acidobacteria bacterium]|nr:hypothetical protein [Acidobacteriota bacterium]MBI3428297.1 hypothetical protein [Acidobacteriota bacterium]